MIFDSKLRDTKASIAIDFDDKRSLLLLAFGGLSNQIGFPMFEFNRVTASLKHINKIYLRDNHRLWYHRGLSDVGADVDGIAACLRQYTTHPSIKRTLVFGNSGAGMPPYYSATS